MRVLLALFLTLFSVSVVAQSRLFDGYHVVPDYRKTGAEAHFSGAAVALSQRQLVGGGFDIEETETEANGTDQEETKDNTIALRWYQPFTNGFVSEFTITKSEGEEKELDPIEPKDESDLFGFLFMGGVQVPNTNSIFGFTFSKVDAEYKSGVTNDTSDSDTRSLGVSYGHKLGEGLHFATGLLQAKESPEDGDSTEINFYFVGLGKIWGDQKKPDMVGELVFDFFNENNVKYHELSLQGLINQNQLQYTGGASLTRVFNDDVEVLGLQLSGGVLYDFGGFYLAPGLTLFTEKTSVDEAGFSDSKENSYNLKFEAGIKQNVHHLYARYTMLNSKDKETGSNPDEVKEKETLLRVGYDYVF